MTDETGMLQHAIFTVPNYREGYTTDDNARALMVSALLEELGNGEAIELASRYLAFIWYAFNTETGRFRNFMDYQRHWLEDGGSDDSHGRTLWALGTVLGRSNTPALQSMAGRVFEQALPAILNTTSPRAWAFALIGIHEYLQRFAGDRRASQVREELAGRLLALYQNHRSDEWRWYEDGADLLQRRAAACLAHVRPIDTEYRHDRSRTGVAQSGWPTCSAPTRTGGILSPSDPTAFISGAVSGPDSINSRWRRKPWSPPVSKPTGSRATNAGARKPAAPSSGSSGATT